MQQRCLVCERQSPDGNLYCEQGYCPGELSPWLLETGEYVGDVEIVRLVTILRSATVYAATRQGEPLFVKVAHQGSQHKERLKREAELLAVAQLKNVEAPFLPALLPATLNQAGNKQDVYTKTVRNGMLLYYYVFAYVEAEPLHDLLRRQSQLWINHIGWIAIQLATALAYMHRRARFHFGLCPEGILVRFAKEPPYAPHILLVDLGIASAGDQFPANWYPAFLMPAYAAPELIDDRKQAIKGDGHQIPPDPRVDVYGLGLVLYELLVGAPPVPSLLRSDADILAAVLRGQRLPMNRLDDVKAVADLALQAADLKLSRRPADPATVGQQLLTHFGSLPAEKRSRMPSSRTLLVVAVALLAIAFLTAFALSLASFAT